MTAPTASPPATQTAFDVFIARQPIFDASNARVAYELLYRSTALAASAAGIGSNAMCNDTALHALVSIGLDRLTGGATAYVNVTREHLVGDLFRVFDPNVVVLELLESIEADDEVIDACARAVADGYTIALDDYDGRASLEALLPFASIVKLDVLGRTASQLAPVIASLRARGMRVLAERVETTEVLAMCRELGCELFQGYVYSRPETLDGRTLSVQDTAVIRILGLVQNRAISDRVLEDAFQSQPALSLTLLRIVRSAAVGVGSVTSIPRAIQVIGRAALARWLMVMLVGSIAKGSPAAHEAVLQALVRARFCELLSVRSGRGDPSARFMVGLLSRMDALLGLPMADVLQRLPVDGAVKSAILDRTGEHGSALRMAEAYESARWETVDDCREAVYLTNDALVDLYGNATQWAMQRLVESEP
jgi:EAL and modified HD-GYP domain-containing signal transduction protein